MEDDSCFRCLPLPPPLPPLSPPLNYRGVVHPDVSLLLNVLCNGAGADDSTGAQPLCVVSTVALCQLHNVLLMYKHSAAEASLRHQSTTV